jgi:hypothetical protein
MSDFHATSLAVDGRAVAGEVYVSWYLFMSWAEIGFGGILL